MVLNHLLLLAKDPKESIATGSGPSACIGSLKQSII